MCQYLIHLPDEIVKIEQMENAEFLRLYLTQLSNLKQITKRENPDGYEGYKKRIKEFLDNNKALPTRDFIAKSLDEFGLEVEATERNTIHEMQKTIKSINNYLKFFYWVTIISGIIGVISYIVATN